jgi:formylglycine-generating enzyme required for sulfatase activity
MSEIEMAFNAGRPILPVRRSSVLPSDDLRYFISTTQWFDAGAVLDASDALPLQVRLRELMAGGPRRIEGASAATWMSRRTFVALLSGLAVTVLLVAMVVPRQGRQSITDATPVAAAPVNDVAAVPDTTPAVAGTGGARFAVNPVDEDTYVWVPPGQFTMGCSPGDAACERDESPAHVVRIAKGFWLGRTEVTASRYRAHGGTGARETSDPALPASGMSWKEARAYCAGIGGRLPTEAEWEYAARAGTTIRYYGSPSDIAWYADNSDDRPHAVAGKAPNAFGLHDMLGNVAEWVRDRYFNQYDENDTGTEEPTAPNATGVARGGSWIAEADGIRVSRRLQAEPEGAPFIGVRCAHDALTAR